MEQGVKVRGMKQPHSRDGHRGAGQDKGRHRKAESRALTGLQGVWADGELGIGREIIESTCPAGRFLLQLS